MEEGQAAKQNQNLSKRIRVDMDQCLLASRPTDITTHMVRIPAQVPHPPAHLGESMDKDLQLLWGLIVLVSHIRQPVCKEWEALKALLVLTDLPDPILPLGLMAPRVRKVLLLQ